MNPFLKSRYAKARRSEAAAALAEQARATLNADDDTAVSVTEHSCTDPGCCATATIVLVMRAKRRTRAVQIDKPVEQVTPADLAQALAPLTTKTAPPQ
jgi:hypothetical protein